MFLSQFTVSQLQDMLTSLRLRRDLDTPPPRDPEDLTDQMDADTGRPRESQRHKRKLVDFKVNPFQKWPTSTPIPYIFDGTHSELNYSTFSRIVIGMTLQNRTGQIFDAIKTHVYF